jgi:hypothetical protein
VQQVCRGSIGRALWGGVKQKMSMSCNDSSSSSGSSRCMYQQHYLAVIGIIGSTGHALGLWAGERPWGHARG